MNLLDVLKDEHATVNRLFSDIMLTASSDRDRREKLFTALKEALIKHAHAEEKVFYPPLREKQQSHDMVEHGIDEHHTVENLLQKLDGIPADSDDWIDALQNLKEKVQDHVREEEGDIFPKAQQLLGDDKLNQMQEQFEEAKAREQLH